ncbi:MAG: GIY-YIG nuclease family protein [bacterium]|nr:GIY-YIG nuclease family protein [bacterium]
MPYVYILECADKTYYTGSSWDLEKRLWQHQNGQGANHTKKRLPVKLVFCQEFERMDEAFHREKQVQGWSHAKKKALIAGGFDEIQKLAKCRNISHSDNDPRKSAPLDSARGAGKV